MQRKANTGKERETRRPADAGKERDKRHKGRMTQLMLPPFSSKVDALLFAFLREVNTGKP